MNTHWKLRHKIAAVVVVVGPLAVGFCHKAASFWEIEHWIDVGKVTSVEYIEGDWSKSSQVIVKTEKGIFRGPVRGNAPGVGTSLEFGADNGWAIRRSYIRCEGTGLRMQLWDQ